MTAAEALRWTEMLLAIALLQRAAEHVATGHHRLFLPQIALAVCLLTGTFPAAALIGLWLVCLIQLHRFDGPYNGGADKMVMLVLTCAGLAHLAPDPYWQDMALAYLAVQLLLSYFVSGWVKVVRAAWRSGRALRDVFAYSAYPASEAMRALAHRPRTLVLASWAVIAFELLFPLALFHQFTLMAALAIGAVFHLANAFCLGLNRFFWAWISAYPALIWFQSRLFG
ncbi:HTTM domain-containing protein [Algicella marina]|uniref:HTTM domain-containing protein n=1 Tax=Algicella marina TaxID=2683284 RepID=A0A6P1T6N2_9RHOB|nr:HTTM domain-containing protein [Algicella marina]QHQ37146.1 HTTM domain-containing protein [Algicella marina]